MLILFLFELHADGEYVDGKTYQKIMKGEIGGDNDDEENEDWEDEDNGEEEGE